MHVSDIDFLQVFGRFRSTQHHVVKAARDEYMLNIGVGMGFQLLMKEFRQPLTCQNNFHALGYIRLPISVG
jgi:hypothetical protein